MLNDEILKGVLDIVNSILGVKSQNAVIMLTPDGKIAFRVDKMMLYIVQTELFTLNSFQCMNYSTLSPLSSIETNDLMYAYNQCVTEYPLLAMYENVHEDEKFDELTKLKAKDGIGYYMIYDSNHKPYRIPMFTGFIKFNKGDKASIFVYDAGPYYMNRFIVKKKKINYPIDIYFLTIKT